MNAILVRWKQQLARFDTLSQREKIMVAVALLAVILLGGDALFLTPALKRLHLAESQWQEQQNSVQDLQAKVAVLQEKVKNPDAQQQAELKGLQQQLDVVDKALGDFQGGLVPADQVAGLLENVLGRSRGLRLVSLKTLPVTGIIPAPKNGEPASPDESNIFKHAVEISIEGSYSELLHFLTEVEQVPQHLIWTHVHLDAATYPKAVLTISVYTLSLDKKWLVV